ncbi:early endosome antigen 1-like isoform X2 [Neocloeon triangulifer]|uniref:early endosome antigen 1-like isoform X2 n=1 Tax=Neocloeon triangulifer TaxID=2078957 RepID=UPI00286EF3F6|nr:early endosome antigen 1-like isoform X2 [Neocloeon triangulifer]
MQNLSGDKRFLTPRAQIGRVVHRTNTADRNRVSRMKRQIDDIEDEMEDVQQKHAELERRFKDEQIKSKDLTKRSQNLQEESDTLRKELSNEKENNKELQTLNTQKIRELQKLREEFAAHVAQHEGLVENFNQLKEEKTKLAQRLSASEACSRNFRESEEQLRSENETLKDLEFQLRQELQRVKLENEQISEMLYSRNRPDFDVSMSPARLSVGENMAEAVTDLKLIEKDEEIETLSKKIESLMTRLQELEAEIDKKDRMINGEKEKRVQLETDRTVLEERLVKCLEELDMSRVETDTIQRKVVELNEDHSSLQAAMEERLGEITRQRDALEQLEMEISETRSSLEKTHANELKLQGSLEEVNSKLNNCQCELAESMKTLGEKTRSLESVQNQLVISKEKISEFEESCKKLEADLQQKEAGLIGVEAECRLLKESVIKFEVELAATTEVMRTKVEELERQKSELEEVTLVAARYKDDFESTKQELEQTKASLDEKLVEHNNLKQDYNERCCELSQSVEKFTHVAKEKDKLENESENLNRHIEELEWELQECRATLGIQVVNLESKRAELEEHIKKLEVSLESTRHELSTTQEILASTSEARDQLVEQLSQSHQEAKSSKAEVSELQSRVESDQDALRSAARQLEDAKQDISNLKEKLEREENESVTSKRAFSSSLESKEQSLLEMSRQLSETSTALTELTTCLANKEQELADCIEALRRERVHLKESRAHVQLLTDNLAASESCLSETCAKLEEAESKEVTLNNTLASRMEKIGQLEEQLNLSFVETEALKEKLEDNSKLLSDKTKLAEDAFEQVLILEQSLFESAENQKMIEGRYKEANDKLEQVTSHLAEKQTKLDSIEQQLEESSLALRNLEQTVHEKEDELARVEEELNETKQNVANLSQELAESAKVLKVKEQETHLALEKISQLEANIVEQEQILSSVQMTLKSEIEAKCRLESQLETLNTQQSNGKIALEKKNADLAKLEKKLSDEKAKVDHLDADLAFSNLELKKSRTKVEKLTEELESKTGEAESLKNEIQAKESSISQLLDKVQEVIAALGEKTAELDDQINQHNQTKRNLNELNIQMEMAGDANTEVRALTEELEKLRADLIHEKTLKSYADENFNRCKEEIKSLQQTQEKYKHEMSLMRSSLAEVRNQYSQLSRANDALKNELQMKASDTEKAIRAKYDKKLEEMKVKLGEYVNNQAAELQIEISNKRKERDQLRVLVAKLKQEAAENREKQNRQAASLAEETGLRRHLEARLADLERKQIIERQNMPPPRSAVPPTRQVQSSSSLGSWAAPKPVVAQPRARSQNTLLGSSNASSNTSSGSTRPLLSGNLLRMEDEEGEQFNPKFLDDLRTGTGVGSDWETGRLSELQRRNSLYPSHLKSSYPVETQFLPDVKEEELKAPPAPDENEWLLGNASHDNRKQKERPQGVQTRYKKPGPPTPGKNNKAPGETTPRSVLRECNQNTALLDSAGKRKSSTPSRLRLLFMGSSKRVGQDKSYSDENDACRNPLKTSTQISPAIRRPVLILISVLIFFIIFVTFNHLMSWYFSKTTYVAKFPV